MPPILKTERKIDWICRVLMTLDVFAICKIYISTLQVKHQLISPLIPKSLISQVLYDTYDIYTTAGLICGSFFLVGLWLYSFKKKIAATILFTLAFISSIIYPMIF